MAYFRIQENSTPLSINPTTKVTPKETGTAIATESILIIVEASKPGIKLAIRAIVIVSIKLIKSHTSKEASLGSYACSSVAKWQRRSELHYSSH